ncbi:MAG: phage minor capsid protein, partial [Christensenellaceae bacterium]
MGISGRAYSDARLAEMKRKNAEGITYEGRHYTGYEATQMQRQIERSIRKTKRELIGFDKAGLKDDFMTSSIKLRRQREYYDDFSNKAGLFKQNERTQVSGYGRSISGKVLYAERNVFTTNYKSDTISSKRNGMSINKVNSPIEQRNTAKGNPNAIMQFGRPLNNRQQKILEKMSGYDSKVVVSKKDVGMKDLSALT